MLRQIVSKIEVKYVKPERSIIRQNEGPRTQEDDEGESHVIGYFMYVILNGKCDVESLNFAKHGKTDYGPKVNRKQNAAESEEQAVLKRSWTTDLNFTY